MITVTRASEAWDLALQLTKWNIKLNQEASERAGYSIHNDVNNPQNYICDLGTRLEINYADTTKVTNIWIAPVKEETPQYIFQLFFKNKEKLTIVTKSVEKQEDEAEYIFLLAQKAAKMVKDENKAAQIGELIDYRFIGKLDELRTY